MAETQVYKKLYRSRSERRIAGVCGGLAVYFRVDPFLIRLIFILFFLAGGAALLIYVIMWLLVPLEPTIMDKTTVILKDERPDRL
ncbi:PspC domain-containing protein [Legionella sp. km772]|uniref:PspC domain-containing protein n=1 Tax=Legionella sp. km772 TaxID=2498111 RepID=UPI000F8EABB7|nr:PspC domain-containing protein [Legionella sp. km772]RUR09730.1 PspC domain-containing protein [Legionella sp. km772]